MQQIKGLALAFVLAGCADLSAVDDYNWTKQQNFEYGGFSWVIADRTNESRLLLRPSMGETFDSGDAISGQDQAITAWFKDRGRDCKILSSKTIAKTWRQYNYICV